MSGHKGEKKKAHAGKTPAPNKSVRVKHPKPGTPHGQAAHPNARPAKPAKSPPATGPRKR